MLILRHLFIMQQLKGLENVFEYAALQMELKSNKWEDVNITAWTRDECIKRPLQTDGYTLKLKPIDINLLRFHVTIEVICHITNHLLVSSRLMRQTHTL